MAGDVFFESVIGYFSNNKVFGVTITSTKSQSNLSSVASGGCLVSTIDGEVDNVSQSTIIVTFWCGRCLDRGQVITFVARSGDGYRSSMWLSNGSRVGQVGWIWIRV